MPGQLPGIPRARSRLTIENHGDFRTIWHLRFVKRAVFPSTGDSERCAGSAQTHVRFGALSTRRQSSDGLRRSDVLKRCY